jgi:ketosteroid isomerase-like protein
MNREKVDQLFRAIDAMNADAFVSFLTPDAVFRFGSSPPVSGQGVIHGLVDGFWSSIAGSSHTLVRTWVDGDEVAVQGLVDYTRKDGRVVRVPFVNVFRMRGDKIAEYLIHIDNSPLTAA